MENGKTNYCLGIDGGGTKTEAVLTDMNAHILARACVGSSNPNDIGLENAVHLLCSLAEFLLQKANAPAAETSLFAGVSGVINHREAMLSEIKDRLGTAHTGLSSDGINLLSAELPMGDGACIICGTGSSCFLRRGNEVIRIGGWGYLMDSAGSGYDIGRQGLEAAFRMYDRRAPKTVLSELAEAYLGAPVELSVTKIYEEGKPLIAGFAPSVFQAANSGDKTAAKILRNNAEGLADLIRAAWLWLTETTPDARVLPVVLGGSVSNRRHPFWENAVRECVGDSVPAVITTARNPVIWGPVAEAFKQSDAQSDFNALLSVFLIDYMPFHAQQTV